MDSRVLRPASPDVRQTYMLKLPVPNLCVSRPARRRRWRKRFVLCLSCWTLTPAIPALCGPRFAGKIGPGTSEGAFSSDKTSSRSSDQTVVLLSHFLSVISLSEQRTLELLNMSRQAADVTVPWVPHSLKCSICHEIPLVVPRLVKPCTLFFWP